MEELDVQYTCAWEARSYTSRSMAAWESGHNDPVAELMEDIFHALDRVDCRDSGEKSAGKSAFLV
jgi:hypothetical protein